MSDTIDLPQDSSPELGDDQLNQNPTDWDWSPNDIDDDQLNQLPRDWHWSAKEKNLFVYQWEGFWFSPHMIKSTIAIQSHFISRDDDVLLACGAKTGTTWLKALVFSIMKSPRAAAEEEEEEDLLVRRNPHDCVQTLEVDCYWGNQCPDLSDMSTPRLFHTHLPYSLLPDSIKNSNCKIVYITRNPKDTFVSWWHFLNTIHRPNQDPFPLEEAFDKFCKGVFDYGPLLDHALQYWNESLNSTEKILFLKYEDLKRDPKGHIKRLGLFLGRPFENDEQVENVVWQCSLDRLKNLDVNKNDWRPRPINIPNSLFFRSGQVGGWKKYLTPEMVDRIDLITRQKLNGTGLHLIDI